MDRRTFLRRAAIGSGVTLAGLLGARLAVPWFLRPGPLVPRSAATQAFVEASLEGLQLDRVWDSHVHLVGSGWGGTGCQVNPTHQSPWHPLKHLQFQAYVAAAGVDDPGSADPVYLARLLALHRDGNPKGKLVMLAFDHVVREDGTEVPAESEFFVPNSYPLQLARSEPDVVPCASIHPYRKDAVQRLEEAVAAGAKCVKWLPNSQKIDPSSPLCDPFFVALERHRVPLLTHAGEERAVDAAEAQKLGNPLLVRRALDLGVTVVIAHCASLGVDEDLDAAPRSGTRPLVSGFDLFLRLMGETQWKGRLFGDISAMPQVNRCCDPLRTILTSPDLQARLLNGSDYPLPAIDVLVSTRQLSSAGLLPDEDRAPLRAVFETNPLLFDLIVKRRLRVELDGRTHKLANSVFETAGLFEKVRA